MKTTKSQQFKLTPLQSETVKAVKAFVKKHGYHCPQKHLVDLFEVNKSTIMKRVNRLVELGFLRKTPDGKLINTL